MTAQAPRVDHWLVIAVFLGSTVFAYAFYARHPVLYDNDAAYHLAIARQVAEDGAVPDELVGVRFSLLRDGFGDKEVLFHVLLTPFATTADPLAGGRLALALFDAAVLTAIAALAMAAIGRWGLLVPFWLVLASTEFAWRLVRLRPELLSLLLLLLALSAAGRGRYRLLGVYGFLYALGYTAFHAFLGLFGLLFVATGIVRRRWHPALVIYPLLGVGLGLLLHPNFPKNLEVWVVQSVDYFVHKPSLDVGTEIRPNFTDVMLLVNLGWFLGLAVLWWSRERREEPTVTAKGEAPGLALAFTVAGGVFGLLYLLMSRFSLYALPLLTLALLFTVRERGERIGGWTRLPGRRRLPLAAALVVVVAVSLPEAWRQLENFAHRTDPGPDEIRLTDRADFAAALPANAHVAATWRQTPIYLLWAPQGRYLNVLDPVFMAVPYPELHAVQERIFAGRAPDVPLAAVADLDSQYLAESLAVANPDLAARLAADPRVRTVYRNVNVLYEFLPGKNDDFVLDWRLVPSADAPEEGQAYPRHPLPAATAVEGYVDARRLLPPDVCGTFLHRLERTEAAVVDYELAPYGPASLWLDGERVVAVEQDLRAILGKGVRLRLALTPGAHELAVHTCPAGSDGDNGFYLLERGRKAPR